MTKTLRFALAAPLALALAACGAGAEETGAIEGEAIAAIPAPEGTEWRSTATMTEDGGTLVGNPDAPLKLIEYGSLTCPTCARFSMEGGEPLLEYVDSGVVSFELRQFAIHGPLDLLLQRMTQCGPDEAVIPLSDQVWANYESIMEPIQTNQAVLLRRRYAVMKTRHPMNRRRACLPRRQGLRPLVPLGASKTYYNKQREATRGDTRPPWPQGGPRGRADGRPRR